MTEAARLAKFEVAVLDAEQSVLYDAIAGEPRSGGPFSVTDAAGRLEGPFNAMLLAPRLGGALQALGSAIRYGGALPDRDREIAILVVAQQWDSAFERYAHEATARAVGLTEAELRALRSADLAALTDPHDRLVASTALALAARSDLNDAEFRSARDDLGLPAVFELLTLVGYYSTLALQLRVFRVETPGDPTVPA